MQASTLTRLDRGLSIVFKLGCGIAVPAALIGWAMFVLKNDSFTYFGRAGNVWPPQIWRTVHGRAAGYAALSLLFAASTMHLGVYWMISRSKDVVIRRMFSLSFMGLAIAVWMFVFAEMVKS